MSKNSSFRTQILALLDELEWLEARLNRTNVNPVLRSRVLPSLLQEIQIQSGSVQRLLEGGKAGSLKEDLWSTFHKVRKKTRPVFRECFAYFQGVLVRDAGLDDGLCDIADAMLYDLSDKATIPWDRFSLLDVEGEFFTDLAQIIRLRFPVSIWNLPVAAHEFGHFVCQKMETAGGFGVFEHPFNDFLRREGNFKPQEMYYLQEHFADVFATYSMGPAFVRACVHLRFTPSTACCDDDRHPAEAKRLFIMLGTLERMNAGCGVCKPYQSVIDEARETWPQFWNDRGSPKCLDRAALTKLEGRLGFLYDDLIDAKLPRSRYQGSGRADRLVNELDGNLEESSEPGDTICDVINGAWQNRLNHVDDKDRSHVRRVSQRAKEFCRAILERKCEGTPSASLPT